MPLPDGNAVMVFLVDGRHRTLLVRADGLLRSWWMPPGVHIDPGGPEIEEARWFSLDSCPVEAMLPASCLGLRLVRRRAGRV